MLKIVEAFSGIGSQAKALSRLGVEFEVVNTIEWDVHAIYAYALIHNKKIDISKYADFNKSELIEIIQQYNLSNNGKEPLSPRAYGRYNEFALRSILAAIDQTNNLVDITKVTASSLSDDIDIFTYSFPCQDLSISGSWHGNKGGIDRDANNRSGMLWEVERILLDFEAQKKPLPRYLIMENVTNIRSARHIDNFNDWKGVLESLGYRNYVYDLKADDLGIPQTRVRTFMLSVLDETPELNSIIDKIASVEDLEAKRVELRPLAEFLRLDYSLDKYLNEAIRSIPNKTPSRDFILEQNPQIANIDTVSLETVRTITTKQDRNPNSGVILHGLNGNLVDGTKKSTFRYLTPRECFLLMGFDEEDYQRLVANNFEMQKNRQFLTQDKRIKLAGNSIVVDVIQNVFEVILEIEKLREELNN